MNMPPNATSAEKWIITCLFLKAYNKKAAAQFAGVSLRRVQDIEKKYRSDLTEIQNEDMLRIMRLLWKEQRLFLR